MANGAKTSAVNWSRQEARRTGGTSSTCWKRAPALDTPHTAATRRNHTHGGVARCAVMGSRSCLLGLGVATDHTCPLEQGVDDVTNDDVDEDEAGHADAVPGHGIREIVHAKHGLA